MAYSDPYEEWKAQGRPGGSFDAWKAGQSQQNAAPTPPPPAPAAPAPAAPAGGGGGGAPAPSSAPGAQGPAWNDQSWRQGPNQQRPTMPPTAAPPVMDRATWEQQARQNAIKNGHPFDASAADAAYAQYTQQAKQRPVQPPQGGPRPNQPAAPGQPGASGYKPPTVADSDQNPDSMKPDDPTGMRAYAQQNGMSEDFGRFSDATLRDWEKDKNPGCPKNLPYKSRIDGGCVEKPIDRSHGPNGYTDDKGIGHNANGAQTPGELATGQQAAAPKGGYGGGGGGGASATSGSGGQGALAQAAAIGGKPGAPKPPTEGQASGTIWDAIMGRLNTSRYNNETMQTLLGGARSEAEAMAQRASEEANRNAAQRGIGRSSIAANNQRDIRSAMYGNVLQQDVQLKKAKVDADYQDKTQAINDGMNWLNSLRNHIQSMAATAAQKEAAMANIKLGYAQLNQQQNMMREQYAQQLQLLGLGM